MHSSKAFDARKTCSNSWCTSPFEITDADLAFYENVSPVIAGKKYPIPSPSLCPACRMQLRTAHRNERFLYRNTSALSGKPILSVYHPEPLWGAPYAVYAEEEWRGDGWDALTFDMPMEPQHGAFAQIAQLHKAVPRIGVINLANENSEFVTSTAYSKNCYLVNSTEYCEDCMYGKLLQRCRSALDCAYLYDSELCYECCTVSKSYGCTFLENSQDCQDCHFSSDLRSCKHCLLCSTLHRKEYCFRNQQLTQQEWEQRLAEVRGGWSAMDQARCAFLEMNMKMVHRHAQITNAEECSGDSIENSQRCTDCYDVTGSQDCRFVQTGVDVQDCIDVSNLYGSKLCAHVLGALNAHALAYCIFVFNSHDMLYCEHCTGCSDCFGCQGLTRKRWCIFNRQYTQDEYEALVPQIIGTMQKDGSWGRFFPASQSPFGYNESLAQEYMPLTKDEALQRGFHWRETTDDVPNVAKIIPAGKLPERIEDIPDDILHWAVRCQETQRPYRITKQELLFYRQMHLPVPRLHPDVRYDRRARLHNPRHLWKRACGKCSQEMETTFAPERPEIVYCEECYLKTMY